MKKQQTPRKDGTYRATVVLSATEMAYIDKRVASYTPDSKMTRSKVINDMIRMGIMTWQGAEAECASCGHQNAIHDPGCEQCKECEQFTFL